MPSASRTIDDEGVLISDFVLVEQDRLREMEVGRLLGAATYPGRNIDQNIADLIAQFAANEKGRAELHAMARYFGIDVIQA